MKSLSCKDAGTDCNFVAQGNTDEEVLKKMAEHGKKMHGMKDADFSSEKVEQFRKLIYEESEHRA